MDIIAEISEQQIKSAYAKGRRLTRDEVLIIKRKLGLRGDHPFPACPARNRARAKKLLESGDDTHMKNGHRCEICGCGNVAGHGTDHYGWGWCFRHEKGKRKGMKKEFAERHLIAIQQRNPAIMANGEKYMETIGEEATVIASDFRIAPAASKVYGILDSFYSLLSKWESDKSARDESVEAVVALRHELQRVEKLDEDLAARIMDTLEAVENKLKFPLTERGGREMSTEVRFKLVATTLKDVMSAMKIMQDISNVNSISVDRFKVWLHKLHRTMIGEFGEQTYVTPDGKTTRIMDGIASSFASTGEPSK